MASDDHPAGGDTWDQFWATLRLAQDRGRHFGALLDAMPDAIYLKDALSRFTWINSGQAANLGIAERSEALGKTDLDFLDADYAASALADERRIIETGESLLDKLERVRNGIGWRWVSTTKVPLAGGDGRVVGIAGITRDITDRYVAEQALRAADRRYRVLFETMAQGVVYGDRDGRVVSANPAAERILGMSLQELRGGAGSSAAWHLVDSHGADLPPERQPCSIAMRTGRPVSGSVLGLTNAHDGERRWLSVDTAPIFEGDSWTPTKVCSVFTDITDSKRAEQALQDSEEKLRGTFEQAAVGMSQVAPDGRHLRVNDRLCDITGRCREELLALRCQDITHPVDTDAELLLMGRVLAGELDTYTLEKRYVRPDGSLVWVYTSVSVARDEDDKPRFFITVVQDISDRKRAERAMWESEYRFRSVFLSMAEGVALHETVYDDDGEPVNYRITEVNSQYEAILGLRRDAIVGKLATEAYGTDEPAYLAEYSAVAETGTIHEFETYFAPMDKHFHISVAPLGGGGFATIFADISQRKRHEEIIRSILARGAAEVGERFFNSMAMQLATALRADATLIAEVRLPHMDRASTLALCVDGRIVANRAYRLAGTPCDEVVAGQVRVYPDGTAGLFPHAELVAEYGFSGYVGVPLSDGHDRPLGVMAAFFREPVKDVRLAESLLGIFAARTAAEINRMRADEERAMLQSEAMRMQHLSSLGVLAGGIAHDFNNILSAIIGYTELADSRLPADGREHAQLQQALAAALRARDLVQQILAFSRQVKSDRKVIDLCSVTREAARFIRASTLSTVDVRVSLPDSALAVMGDATQLHQVIVNLCTNAIQAIGDGRGEVSVSLVPEAVEPGLAKRLGGIAEGPYAHMTVRDTGCGMDEETLARVFEPFYTTKDPGEGTGLGLATAHGVVTDHGGAITAQSDVGVGSAFHVYLPCCTDGEAERGAAETDIPVGSERILFVDDEPFLAEMAAQVLQSLGYDVVTKTDSREAWETFRQSPDTFDLLITDQTMPHLTGLDLIERFRRIRPEIPVIIMTGYHQKLLDARPSDLGVWEIVPKPYSIRALGRAVRGALDSVKR